MSAIKSRSRLNKIQSHNPEFKLFLTNFKDYTYFPHDAKDVFVLHDGKGFQKEVLTGTKNWRVISHRSEYSYSILQIPQTVSNENIMDAAPNTIFILHAIDD